MLQGAFGSQHDVENYAPKGTNLHFMLGNDVFWQKGESCAWTEHSRLISRNLVQSLRGRQPWGMVAFLRLPVGQRISTLVSRTRRCLAAVLVFIFFSCRQRPALSTGGGLKPRDVHSHRLCWRVVQASGLFVATCTSSMLRAVLSVADSTAAQSCVARLLRQSHSRECIPGCFRFLRLSLKKTIL